VRVRAVVFDMDGLVVDSEPLWIRAEIEVFGRVGVTLDAEDCERTKGLRLDDVVAFWHARKPWDEARGPSLQDLQAELVARVAELLREEGRALPGVHEALALAREGGRPVALASSSPRVLIDAVLARLGLEHAFDVVQSAETEPLGKPHPSIFLTTASRLGVAPTDCVVLEDSLTGVIAAKAARMACVAVPMGHPHHDPRFVIADVVVGSLHEVTRDLLATIAKARG